MMKYIFFIIFLLLLVLPILAPVLLAFHQEFIANILYGFFQWFCHQRTWRSYHIFDFQIAYCAREVGLFIGLTVSSFIVTRLNFYENNTKRIVVIILICLVPMALDGGIQAFAEVRSILNNSIPFYESVNLVRSLTGIILGVGLGTTLVPFVNNTKNKNSKKALSLTNYIIILSFSILILMCVNSLSYLSSTVYKPSSLFFDLEERYPGVNYEITTNGGHAGNLQFRVISEDKGRYCEIAKNANLILYNKFCKN